MPHQGPLAGVRRPGEDAEVRLPDEVLRGHAPRIMEEGVEWSLPETTFAAESCNEEVPEWVGKAEAGAKAAKGAILSAF